MRLDNVTGKLIQNGYCFGDGDFYCESEEDALKHAREQGFKDLEDSFNAENHYWTEWEFDENRY